MSLIGRATRSQVVTGRVRVLESDPSFYCTLAFPALTRTRATGRRCHRLRPMSLTVQPALQPTSGHDIRSAQETAQVYSKTPFYDPEGPHAQWFAVGSGRSCARRSGANPRRRLRYRGICSALDGSPATSVPNEVVRWWHLQCCARLKWSRPRPPGGLEWTISIDHRAGKSSISLKKIHVGTVGRLRLVQDLNRGPKLLREESSLGTGPGCVCHF